MQMQASGKLVLANLGGADGSTSLTGTISIDSTYGINAQNVAHEYFHTIQMGTFMSAGQGGSQRIPQCWSIVRHAGLGGGA